MTPTGDANAAVDWWLEMPPSDDELVFDDGEPMDSPDHRRQAALLVDVATHHFRGRDDAYVGANEALYFSANQARSQDFRAPDFFVVLGCDGPRFRKGWVVWNEEGKVPDLIIELLSPTTEAADRGVKRDTYERLGVQEYILFDVINLALEGYRRVGARHVPISRGAEGRLHSEVLGLDFGLASGPYQGTDRAWLRCFAADGTLLPSGAEAEAQRAEAEARRAEAEAQRAEAEAQRAEAEAQRTAELAAKLAAYEARFGPLDPPG